MLFSLLLPPNFFYRNKNDADTQEPVVVIKEGVLIQGAIKKTNLGSSHKSLVTTLYQEYGETVCVEFLNDVQFLSNQYLLKVGFSVGISDCLVTKKDEIQAKISRSFLKAKSIEEHTKDERIRDAYVSFALSGARDTGMAIAKNALQPDNRFIATVVSGAKGDYFNIAQITGLLGQQNLNGQRVQPLLSNNSRTLPHYPIDKQEYTDDMKYESAGFIRSSFVQGLSPREYFFHAMTGREGITDTAMKTATSGYIQRRMIKIAEDIQVKYDGTVRNSVNNIIQFAYGDNFMDPMKTTFLGETAVPCDVERLVETMNFELSSSSSEV
jgi:DNA-directed RNA polymerase II subunit RPB1